MIVFMMQRTRPSNHVHTNSSLLGCMNPLPLQHQLAPNTPMSNIKAQPDLVFSPCKVHTQAQHFLHCSLRSGTAEEEQASPFTHLGPGWRKKQTQNLLIYTCSHGFTTLGVGRLKECKWFLRLVLPPHNPRIKKKQKPNHPTNPPSLNTNSLIPSSSLPPACSQAGKHLQTFV